MIFSYWYRRLGANYPRYLPEGGSDDGADCETKKTVVASGKRVADSSISYLSYPVIVGKLMEVGVREVVWFAPFDWRLTIVEHLKPA